MTFSCFLQYGHVAFNEAVGLAQGVELQVNFICNSDSLERTVKKSVPNLHWMTTSYANEEEHYNSLRIHCSLTQWVPAVERYIVMVKLIKEVNGINVRLEGSPAIHLWFDRNVDCPVLYLMCRAEICWLSTVTGHTQNTCFGPASSLCLSFIIFYVLTCVRIKNLHFSPCWTVVSVNACFWLVRGYLLINE